LRKLLRNLEEFYHAGLKKDADFDSATSKVASIARSSDKEAIAEVFELVAAAAVTCENRTEFVSRIMTMTQESQIQMKGIIEASLSRLSDFDAAAAAGDEDEIEENELVFGQVASISAAHDDDDHLFTARSFSGGRDEAREELEKALADARRELAAHKSQASLMAEDSEGAQKKLKVLVEDLQDRLDKRQEELVSIEGQFKMTTMALEDAKARIEELEEKNSQLADDLDVANSKAEQLRKAEATVVAYRKKLDGVGAMSQQVTDLEDQAAAYLKQIVDLENDVKKIPTMQKTIDELREQLAAFERESGDVGAAVKGYATEIADLKSRLTAAEAAKKMYEEELSEFRAQQGVTVDDEVVSPMAGLSLSENRESAENKEKVMRLEIENNTLKSEIDQLKSGAAAAAGVKDLRSEVERLKDELEKKEAEKAKIGADKEKLEAYTKRTLAKFQEKYLVALQECKAKLKEKQDKIEALENRSASEKTAQKREERLLSSTIYELGLTIMQNRLKER
jgi:protein HOOK3